MNKLGNDNIIIKKENGIEYIQFKRLLEHGIKHAYTLKGEGINFRTGSEEEKESYQKIFDCLGIDIETFVKPQQKHTDKVVCIDKVMKNDELLETDGLITDKENKLYELEEQLSKNKFIRISNSCIINVEKTKSFDTSIIGSLVAKMEDETKQEVSKRRITSIYKCCDGDCIIHLAYLDEYNRISEEVIFLSAMNKHYKYLGKSKANIDDLFKTENEE